MTQEAEELTSTATRAVLRHKAEIKGNKIQRKEKISKKPKKAKQQADTDSDRDSDEADNLTCCVCSGEYRVSKVDWIRCVLCSLWLHEDCSALDGKTCGICSDSD